MGDVREDGYVFQSYNPRLRQDGTFAEQWRSPKDFFKSKVRNALKNARVRAAEASLPWDLDLEYLLSIYPADGKCPVLKMPLVFGGRRRNSPSLDRFVPSLGYVRGNVCWISDQANIIKQDITDPEVFIAVANYVRGGVLTTTQD
jgi:hypothetical protein